MYFGCSSLCIAYKVQFGVYWVQFSVVISNYLLLVWVLLVNGCVALGWVRFLLDYMECPFVCLIASFVV